MTFIIIGALFFSGCGKTTDPVVTTAELMPLYATTAESLTSMVATELGTLSGPPTPGALALRSCAATKCTGTGKYLTVEKRLENCSSRADGTFSGNVFVSVVNVPEADGCSTPQGPPEFRSWPPTSGTVRLEFGTPAGPNVATASIPTGGTYEHIESTGRHSTQWGKVTLHFNGSRDTPIEVDQWARIAGSKGHSGRFHFTSTPEFRIHTEEFSDFRPRSFFGAYLIYDDTHHIAATVTLDNVTYRKHDCCHPLSGSIVIVTVSENEAGPSRVIFSDEFCGKATLIDPLGRSQLLALPGCSS